MTFDAPGAGWFVLEVSVRALAAAVAVAFVLRMLRVRAAAVVHAAWTAVLVAMLLMPVLPSLVPALPVPLPAGPTAWLGEPELASRHVAPRGTPATNTDTSPSTRTGGVARMPDPLPAPMARRGDALTWLAAGALGVYASGVLLLVVRLLVGWRLAAGMIRRARRNGAVPMDVAAPVYESADVTVPIAAGAFRPAIVLPAGWRTWDAETLAAVVAHESAHVRRRDPAVAFLARLNRAVFWFHPLAWWLERTLAVTAEHACDEAAVRAIAAPGRYAEILVEMADVVRRSGGRVAWQQAVGVNSGLLERRIARLLGSDGFASASRRTKIAAGIGCVLVIGAVMACRQQVSATPLREDPELAATLASRQERTRRFEAARDLTQEQADALEQRVAASPQDFDARRQLVTYYQASSKVAWDRKVPGLRRHALWLIEHHPEHEVVPPPLSPRFDPEGFAAARALWEAHLAKPDASPFLVFRAARFFAPHDRPYAERLIQRGIDMDPGSAALKARMPPDVGGYDWRAQLASLYAAALLDSESANSPYAARVRRTLDGTLDARLLARVGSGLVRPIPPANDPAAKQAREEARALGVRYLERALELDPDIVSARATLVRLGLGERATEADRLANRAHEQYLIAEDITEYARKDLAAGRQQRAEARARAEEALKLAGAHSEDPAYSAAIMTAHHVLALDALRDDDRERAVQHLRDSVKVPPSEQLRYAPPFSWLRPVNRLLKAGERERIAEFLEAFAALTVTDRERLLTDAAAIRQGRMPSSYQQTLAREGQ